jgi:hypothetical protein
MQRSHIAAFVRPFRAQAPIRLIELIFTRTAAAGHLRWRVFSANGVTINPATRQRSLREEISIW